jgi:hypothetical protein
VDIFGIDARPSQLSAHGTLLFLFRFPQSHARPLAVLLDEDHAGNQLMPPMFFTVAPTSLIVARVEVFRGDRTGVGLEYLMISEQDTGAYTDNCVMVAVAAIKADILRFRLAESPGVSAAN